MPKMGKRGQIFLQISFTLRAHPSVVSLNFDHIPCTQLDLHSLQYIVRIHSVLNQNAATVDGKNSRGAPVNEEEVDVLQKNVRQKGLVRAKHQR